MRINIAKSAGFCFGVKRALDIAFKTAPCDRKVYMLGDIVHNETVIKKIEKCGINKIKKLKKTDGAILLIRAHGASLGTLNKAGKLGYEIIDATCPMVKEIQMIVKDMHNKGYSIIIIGDKNHEEVRGIAGQLKKRALIIDRLNNTYLAKAKQIKKACLVVQSTQNLEKALKIADRLRRYIPDLRFFNTICKPTRIKQEEIRKMPLENDVMLIIGSKTSANTKRLYEISRSLNNKSYWINSWKEIKPACLKNATSVGITAGASTPEETIKDIVEYIRAATK